MKFDIDTYAARAAKLDLHGVDFEEFQTNPLDADSLRCLRYMHDVEFHTVCYLRDLLVTQAHNDPDITAFLTIWNFEEYWHGEAIGQVLSIHDEIAGAERIERLRLSLGRFDRLKPIPNMLASYVFKEFPAVHMTWGAINEWLTQAAYSRLIAKADNPVLSELLRRLMKQEGRHVDFYASQATERLERSRAAQRLTRGLLKRKWAPVGSGVMPEEEVRFMANHLFAGDEGRKVVQRIDRHIDRLPGLENLSLVENAVVARTPRTETVDIR